MNILRTRRARVAAGAAFAAVLTSGMLLLHRPGQASSDLAPGATTLNGAAAAAIQAAGYSSRPAIAGQSVSISQTEAQRIVLEGRPSGYTVLSAPALQWVDQPSIDSSPNALHCLCWVVEVKSPNPLPRHGPSTATTEAHYVFLQFIDATTGETHMVLAGSGLG